MDTVFQDILHAQEQEDSRLFCSDADRLTAFCGEFSNAQRLLAQAREKGFSLSDFFSGAPLPAGLELPTDRPRPAVQSFRGSSVPVAIPPRAMQALADLLRGAVDRKVLTEDDLYQTEPLVIQRLEADPVSAAQWRRFRRFCRVERRMDRPEGGIWYRIPAKLRYIDPLVACQGRLSQLDPGVRRAQESFLATDFTRWIGVPEDADSRGNGKTQEELYG